VLRRIAAVWAAVFRSTQLDADMDDEMRFHVEMHAERLMRERGLDAKEARRQALVAFGGVEKYKVAGRDMRGTLWLDALHQDCRLAVRMLIKYPALTLIGGFAMAVAIAIGSLAFHGISELLKTSLPIEDGDRLVAVQLATDRQGSPERRVLRDFVEWREGLTTIRQLSAFRTASQNLRVDGSNPEAIRVAEVTASAFSIATAPPLLGRVIQPQDESLGAPPVIVIGWDAWQTRFAADPQIVGRTAMLGGVAHTIVGVMPQGFKFPVSHDYWLPLQFTSAQYERLQGPSVFIFGKLAPGATLEQANAEMTAIGQRTAAAHPDLYPRHHLIVLPYAREHVEIDRPEIVWLLQTVRLMFSLLLVVVAANLAILMYARTVARLGEIAVRSALGASRQRLLMQLFIEALALSLLGAAVGLVIAFATMTPIKANVVDSGGLLPFWITLDLSVSTLAYAIGLALLAALIVGVLPGLRATGQQTHTNLRALSGGTGKPLGWVWTSLIVTQVAIASAILPLSIYMVGEAALLELERPGFAVDQFLLAMVEDGRRQEEILTRLQQEPGIRQVSFSSSVPGYEGSRYVRFENASADVVAALDNVNTLEAGAGLFGIYETALLAGRDFTSADVGSTNVIVNRTMANILARDGGVLGRQFTYVQPSEAAGTPPRTYQIVGVVDDFPKFPIRPHSDAARMVYHATDLTGRAWLTIRYRTAVTPEGVDSVRRAVAEVDAAAPLELITLSEFYRVNRSPFRWIAIGLTLITASVLLLSAAGLYALMSFTVAQRTREIGIRSALGANPRRLLAGIFGRVLAQVSIGLVLGSLLSGGLIWSVLEWREAVNVAIGVAAVIVIVGVGAAVGPARRGLRINPTEALRTDA
jgi:putative ABC transport system permease protein